MSRKIVHSKIVEVHGDDASAFTVAKNFVKRTIPGAQPLNARYGIGRCDHGSLLVEVTYQIEEEAT